MLSAWQVWGERMSTVAVKLLMSWDIRPGQEKAYFNFVVQEFAPALLKLGLESTEAWYTVYGEVPQILTSGETHNLSEMERILRGEEWHKLKARLLNYVTNFREKVVPASNRFQLL
jgi:hypothetical protein